MKKPKMGCKRCGKIIVGMGHNMATHLRTACPKAKMKPSEQLLLNVQKSFETASNQLKDVHEKAFGNGKFDPIAFADSIRKVDVAALEAELVEVEKRRNAINDVLRAAKSLVDIQ